MKKWVLVMFVAVALHACNSGRLVCTGPQDCSGNACCYTVPALTGSVTLACASAPSACVPARAPDRVTRLCHTDADCTAGGISTSETRCCAASVMSLPARTCTDPSLCSSSSYEEAVEEQDRSDEATDHGMSMR